MLKYRRRRLIATRTGCFEVASRIYSKMMNENSNDVVVPEPLSPPREIKRSRSYQGLFSLDAKATTTALTVVQNNELQTELNLAHQEIQILRDQNARLMKQSPIMRDGIMDTSKRTEQQNPQRQTTFTKKQKGKIGEPEPSIGSTDNDNTWTMKISLSSTSDDSSTSLLMLRSPPSEDDNDCGDDHGKLEFNDTDKDDDESRTACISDLYLEDDDDNDAALSYLTVGDDSPSDIWLSVPFENPLDWNESHNNGNHPQNLPLEIMAISSNHGESSKSPNTTATTITIEERLQQQQIRAKAFRYKLEQTEDLVASLFRDLERAKHLVYRLANKNRNVTFLLENTQEDMEDNTIRRNKLAHAVMCICPLFMFTGHIQTYLLSVMLVWIFIEVDSIINMDIEDEDEELQEEEKQQKQVLQKG